MRPEVKEPSRLLIPPRFQTKEESTAVNDQFEMAQIGACEPQDSNTRMQAAGGASDRRIDPDASTAPSACCINTARKLLKVSRSCDFQPACDPDHIPCPPVSFIIGGLLVG